MNKVLKKSKLLVLAVPAVALQTGCSMNYVDETVTELDKFLKCLDKFKKL